MHSSAVILTIVTDELLHK